MALMLLRGSAATRAREFTAVSWCCWNQVEAHSGKGGDKDFIKRNPSKIIRLSRCFLVMTAEEVLSLTCHWKLCLAFQWLLKREGFDYTGGIGLQRALLGFKWRHTDHGLPFLRSPCQPPLSTLLPYPGLLPVVILNFISH